MAANTTTAHRTILACIVGLALLVRCVYLVSALGHPFNEIPWVATQTDMYGTVVWARAIADGDLWSARFDHLFPQWMADIAPQETWHRWWGGEQTLRRTPLYEYLTAGSFALFGETPYPLLILQLLIGALACIPVAYAGTRLFGARAGLLAAAITAIYGPSVYVQMTLMRDALIPNGHIAIVALILWAGSRNSWPAWAAVGAAVGVATLLKSTSAAYLFLAGAWLIFARWPGIPKAIRAAAAMGVAFLLAVSPLVVRNVRVGIHPLSTDNLFLEGLVIAWAADANPIGLNIPLSIRTILPAADGDRRKAIELVIETYHGDAGRFLSLQLTKLRALFDPLEIPNNLNYQYARNTFPILRVLPGFAWLAPFGLLGLALSIRSFRRHWLVPAYLGLTSAAPILVCVIDRYRIDAVLPLTLLAAHALDRIWTHASRRAYRSLLLLGAGAAAIFVIQHVASPVPAIWRVTAAMRPLEYYYVTGLYESRGDLQRAADELRRYRGVAHAIAPGSAASQSFAQREAQLRAGATEKCRAAADQSCVAEQGALLLEAEQAAAP